MNPYRALSDDDLLAQCRVEFRRASGPGGQHRNKVETAVRIVHAPTGIVATAADSRSQHANRVAALARLRDKLDKLFHREAPRVKTKKSRGIRRRELEVKRKVAEKKKLRSAPREE